MKRIIVGQKKRVADWVSNGIGCNKWSVDYEALGLEMDGKLVGGVVVDGYVEDARCAMHVAGEGKRWLNREFIWVVFNYVFGQLKCKVALAPVASTNAASLKFAKSLGFVEACRIENGALNSDLVILKMPKAQCRWLEKKP
jgi:RimJ/RimL family protein N-acetyltransferase